MRYESYRWNDSAISRILLDMGTGDEQQRVRDELAQRAPSLRTALLVYFRRRLRSNDDAEDLVQDTFARIAARDSTDPVEKLGGYVFKTAASVLSDWARRRRSQRTDRHVSFDPDMHAGTDIDPDQILAGKEDLRITLEALLSLPERTRTAFLLFKMEEMPQRDIAHRLGISVSAVEKHVMRAVQHLANALRSSE